MVFNMAVIPLHSLILCSDPNQLQKFAPYECMSLTSISHDLVGDVRQIALHRIAFQEMCHRVGLKLSLGERVVIAEPDSQYTQQLIDIAIGQGAYVIDMCDVSEPFEIVTAFMTISSAVYRGITVIGDIHGDLKRLHTAMAWAESRQNFAWLLGDVIDYGADTLACLETVYHAVMRGSAGLILGNHERKIARWVDQRHVRISEGNRITTEALAGLAPSLRQQWIGRFRSLLSHAHLLYQIENVTLIHAATHPSLWTRRPDAQLIEQFGLYGQGETNGRFHRVHHWVNAVPAGQLVFVGHDVISPFPIIVSGTKGGQVVFLDTGCGKNGALSTADLRFTETGLRLECFNRHEL